ncbi:MAG: hypothetical protein OCD02_22550 [Spirochaetaceae bacterium]
MNEIILFGEETKVITSSCTSCSGCDDKSEHLCTDNTPQVTSEELTEQLLNSVKKAELSGSISVEFRDIHSEDLSEYKDVATLINMSFSFPILTVNKKIKYMGPFDSDILLADIKETLGL